MPIKDFVDDLVQLRVSAQDEFGNTGVQELTFSICKHPHCLRLSLLHLWLNNFDALSTYVHKVKVFVYMWQPLFMNSLFPLHRGKLCQWPSFAFTETHCV